MNIDEPRAMPNPERTPYQLIGGEEKVRALVTRFYDLMDEDPDYFGIRKLHPPSLDGSREKLFMFLTGWLGGPPIYADAFGHPRLRARHLPFAIGPIERDQWMACMAQALSDVGVEADMRARLVASFANTADWMRNKEP
jgi:hemoglobin